MAEKIVSPGVFTNEIDQSFIPAALADIGAAVVGPTVKGPILEPTVVSSYGEYVQKFGELIESGSDKYQYLTSHTAKEYLAQGGPLTVVRVADPTAAKATAVVGGGITGAVTAVNASRTITMKEDLPDNDETLSIQVGSTTAQVITFKTADGTNVTTFSGNAADLFMGAFVGSAAQKLDQVAEQVEILIDSMTGISAAHVGETNPGVITITADTAEATDSDLTISSTADGTAEIVIGTAVAGVAGVAGTDSSIFTLQALGAGPQFNNTSSFGTDNLLTPLTSSRGNDYFVSGSHGGRSDNFRWEVSQRNLNKGTFTLLIRQGNDTSKRKVILETHANLSLDPESTDYILKRVGNQTNTIATDDDGVAYLKPVGEYPNLSKYVRVSTLKDANKTPNYLDENGNVNAIAYPNSGSFFPAVGSGSYGGAFGDTAKGTSGQTAGSFGAQKVVAPTPFAFYDSIAADNNQGILMNSSTGATQAAGTGGYTTALSILSNKDEYNFNLLFLPGVLDNLANHKTVITQAIDICESRGDCFLVYDSIGKDGSVSEINNVVKSRNSSYAATYYPWVQIQDSSLGTYRYVPPSTVIAGVYHFNDVVGQPWFAPAGLNRGGIDTVIQAYKKLTQANRDQLYDSNVNPIATFPGQGVTVFGQKTTQKKASALDRVNVRRLLINIKSFVSRSSRNLVFEQNTTDLRDQFLNTVNPFLEQVQANAGLQAFEVIMDDTNNTPETIDRNQLVGLIRLQPTRTAEFIVLDFTIEPSGAAFDD